METLRLARFFKWVHRRAIRTRLIVWKTKNKKSEKYRKILVTTVLNMLKNNNKQIRGGKEKFTRNRLAGGRSFPQTPPVSTLIKLLKTILVNEKGSKEKNINGIL